MSELPNMDTSKAQTSAADVGEGVDALNRLAWELRHTDPKRALEQAQVAYAEATAASYRRGEAYSLLTLAFCHLRLADPATALEQARAGLSLFETLAEPEGKRRALNLLGIIYGESDNLTGALETFLATQRLCEELGDQAGEADALNNTGVACLYLGDYTGALEYYSRSFVLYEQLGSKPGQGRTLLNIGVVHYELGHFESALGYLLRSLEIEERLEDKHTFALVLENLGRTYLKLGKYQEALSYIQKSLSLMETLGDQLGSSYARDDLGLLYQEFRQEAQAHRCWTESLEAKEALGDKKGAAETALHLGRLYLAGGHLHNPGKALEVLQAGFANALAADAKVEVYRCHQALAEVYRQQGDFPEAYRHLEHYANVRSAVFNTGSDLRFQSLRVRSEVEQAEREREIYRLRNVELANALGELRELTVSLQRADEEKSRLLKQLEVQAQRDALTGLYNRRYFDLQLEQEFSRATRFDRTLSVVMCDIDNFKSVNDNFSHQVGDDVLRRVADILTASLRKVDTLARYGGEEFVMLFPETSAHEAAQVCERMRRAVERYPWAELYTCLEVTVSIGVADDLSVVNHEKLIYHADRKLYEAKRSGKNQIKF